MAVTFVPLPSLADDPPSIAGHVVVVPGVSYGNVGQLACDALVATGLRRHTLRLAGHLTSPDALPCAGVNPYDAGGATPSHPSNLCVNLEVFQTFSRVAGSDGARAANESVGDVGDHPSPREEFTGVHCICVSVLK